MDKNEIDRIIEEEYVINQEVFDEMAEEIDPAILRDNYKPCMSCDKYFDNYKGKAAAHVDGKIICRECVKELNEKEDLNIKLGFPEENKRNTGGV